MGPEASHTPGYLKLFRKIEVVSSFYGLSLSKLNLVFYRIKKSEKLPWNAVLNFVYRTNEAGNQPEEIANTATNSFRWMRLAKQKIFRGLLCKYQITLRFVRICPRSIICVSKL